MAPPLPSFSRRRTSATIALRSIAIRGTGVESPLLPLDEPSPPSRLRLARSSRIELGKAEAGVAFPPAAAAAAAGLEPAVPDFAAALDGGLKEAEEALDEDEAAVVGVDVPDFATGLAGGGSGSSQWSASSHP